MFPVQQDDERIIQEIQKEGEEELNKKAGGGSRNASRSDANLLFLTCGGCVGRGLGVGAFPLAPPVFAIVQQLWQRGCILCLSVSGSRGSTGGPQWALISDRGEPEQQQVDLVFVAHGRKTYSVICRKPVLIEM